MPLWFPTSCRTFRSSTWKRSGTSLWPRSRKPSWPSRAADAPIEFSIEINFDSSTREEAFLFDFLLILEDLFRKFRLVHCGHPNEVGPQSGVMPELAEAAINKPGHREDILELSATASEPRPLPDGTIFVDGLSLSYRGGKEI